MQAAFDDWGRAVMNHNHDKQIALMHYLTTMKIIENWLGDGLISKEEYEKIDTMMTKKFGISSSSVWRRCA